MIKEIIKKSPNWIQNSIKSMYYYIPYEKRLGQEFKKTYNFLKESQWWSKKQHEEYQMMEIEKLIKYSYEYIPYYTQLFNERGLKPGHIQNFNDLKQVPYLTKEIVKNNLDKMISTKYNSRNISYVTTGGSTGEPMGFYEDKRLSNSLEWAYITSQWSRVGYDINKINKCVILRGDIPNNGLYQFKGYDLILSSYKLTENNMLEYLQLIEKFNPHFMQAYPSAIYILSEFILKNNIKINLTNMKAILCGSENLYDFQRKKISQAFNVRVYSWYGHSEKCCLAGECEEKNNYHIFSEYGYVELLNDRNEEATKEGESGEIICTGFNNYVMPFIRYKTGDIAINTNITCSCGRNYKSLKSVKGRKQEIIITKNGSKVMLTGSYKIFDRISEYIEAGQFYQEKQGCLELRIIKKNNYTNVISDYINTEIKNKFGKDIDLKIIYVDSIKRTSRGKQKFLVQKLDII